MSLMTSALYQLKEFEHKFDPFRSCLWFGSMVVSQVIYDTVGPCRDVAHSAFCTVSVQNSLIAPETETL